ncbi:MAG: hypothetical protein F6J86_06165 [Symploca sp. SIO1B1]|nr:hypothetical protein [Symploca sp. SIO1B1]
MSSHTVKSLADEAGMYLEDMIPLLARLGMKDATHDQKVKPAIASAVLRTVKTHNDSLQKQMEASQPTPNPSQEGNRRGTEGEEDPGELALPEKLKLKHVKGVAQQSKVTQAFVKDLSTAIYNRKMDLLVQKGLEDYRREQEAVEAGRLYAQIEELQTQQQAVLDLEESLYTSQSEARTESVLGKVGFDLQGLIDDIQNQQEEDANKREKRAAIVERIENGEELTEEELQDPFVMSRYDWYQSRVENLSA